MSDRTDRLSTRPGQSSELLHTAQCPPKERDALPGKKCHGSHATLTSVGSGFRMVGTKLGPRTEDQIGSEVIAAGSGGCAGGEVEGQRRGTDRLGSCVPRAEVMAPTAIEAFSTVNGGIDGEGDRCAAMWSMVVCGIFLGSPSVSCPFRAAVRDYEPGW